MMINANQYHATTQAVHEAIDASKAEDRTATIEAIGTTYEAVEIELLAECESHDDEGLFWGADLDGNEWQVRLVGRA